jgi:uncharacterized membrane protein YbaN (DUF454 family)
VKPLFVVLGTIFLAVGAIGVVVPGLPTTPFLLLSAAMFLRSSETLYRRLVSSRFFGRYIRSFREGGGMTAGAKAGAISIMWGTIALSVALLRAPVARYLVLAAGAVGTVVMGFVVRTVRGPKRGDRH